MYKINVLYARSVSFIDKDNRKTFQGSMDSSTECEYQRHYDLVNGFLYGNQHESQLLEYGQIELQLVDSGCLSDFEWHVDLDYNIVFNNTYNIFTMNFFCGYQDITSDDFIKFRKALEHYDLFRVKETDVTFNEMMNEKMARYVETERSKSESSTIIELNGLTDGNQMMTYGQFDDELYKMLYGLITTDEGWHYVSSGVTEKLRQEHWNSRSFIHSFPFTNGVMVFNETESESYREYKAFQRKYWQRVNGRMNYEYFDTQYGYAGMEHGFFHLVEQARLVKLILSANLSVDYFLKKHTVIKISKERKRMLNVINMLHGQKVNELEGLAKEIFDVFDIFEMAQTVETRLELAEADTIIKYEMRTNLLATIIAVIGLYLTISIEFENIRTLLTTLLG